MIYLLLKVNEMYCLLFMQIILNRKICTCLDLENIPDSSVNELYIMALPKAAVSLKNAFLSRGADLQKRMGGSSGVVGGGRGVSPGIFCKN